MHPTDRTMLRQILAPFMLALVVASCAGDESAVDAELARDLQLASQEPARPQFQDMPLNDLPRPAAANSTPVGPTRPRSAPPAPARAPRPAPVVQTPRVSEAVPTVVPREAPASAPVPSVMAGTSFGLTTRGQVCTSNLPGDKIVATTTEAVSGENGALIPAGTSVVLEVVSVTPGDTPESARISLRVRSILIGDPIGMEGNVTVLSGLERGDVAQNDGSDKKKVIGGAIAGAVIGQIMGRDTRSTVIGAAAGAAAGTAAAGATRRYHACLPAGGSLRVTTSQPIILSD